MASFGGTPAHILCAADYFREKFRRETPANDEDTARVLAALFDNEHIQL
jgi:hypothetical protein